MARCRAHVALSFGGELNCDLEEHDLLLNFHYDKSEDIEWKTNHIPAAVPYTRTGPLKVLKEAA